MLKKVCYIAILVIVTAAWSGCSPLMVKLGLEDAPPPVTDSSYYNTQIDKLLTTMQKTQLRPFRKAAVLDFVNSDGRVSELGKYLTSKFGERALSKGMFRVITSGQVKDALNKLKIDYSGQLTKQQAEQIGVELSADAVVTGTVSDLQKGSDVDVNVKVIQASSGDIVSAGSVNIYRSKQVQTLIQQF